MGKLGLHSSPCRQLEQVLIHPQDARQLKRAQALLWVDEGEPVSRVAARLRVSRQSIYTWVGWINQRSGRLVERLEDQTRSGRPRTTSDLIDAQLPSLLRTAPAAFGYQATGWTTPLLAVYFSQQ
jgi:transposase